MKRMIIVICFFYLFIFNGDISATFCTVDEKVALTAQEQEYVSKQDTIQLGVDPDWYPYEKIDDEGNHIGIAADLIALVSSRTGLKFELVPTKNWDETLQVSRMGKIDVVSFLNKTKERSQWLLFTDPYFVDPNVLITREEHDYISNLARISNEVMVLPEGTSIEERLRHDFPNLKIILVKSEQEAISYVDGKKADMTLRSLTMAAYIIKNDGYFNLKIAGEIPDYANYLRMGVTNQNVLLQQILNKGIASISEQEIQQVINQHISIKVTKGFDYKLFGIVVSIFSMVLLVGVYWINKMRKMAEELELKNKLLEEAASTDTLTGLRNRKFFNLRINEEIEKANRYHSKVSLLIIDLDLFKRINDTYGHDAGDQVILYVTETLQSKIRKVDMLARWGGEEFVILLPEIGLNEAVIVTEKLRHEAEQLIHLENETVTISVGVSTWTTEDTLESWFKRTDRALYHAKQQGRNRVCMSERPDERLKEILVWNTMWESGHFEIDEQHKALLNACNELVSSIIEKDLRFMVLPELESIIQLIKIHFSDEESILMEMNYSGALSHRMQHQQLLDKAEALIIKSRNGQILPSDVIRFIVDEVVTKHLAQEDVKFFDLFKKNISF